MPILPRHLHRQGLAQWCAGPALQGMRAVSTRHIHLQGMGGQHERADHTVREGGPGYPEHCPRDGHIAHHGDRTDQADRRCHKATGTLNLRRVSSPTSAAVSRDREAVTTRLCEVVRSDDGDPAARRRIAFHVRGDPWGAARHIRSSGILAEKERHGEVGDRVVEAMVNCGQGSESCAAGSRGGDPAEV